MRLEVLALQSLSLSGEQPLQGFMKSEPGTMDKGQIYFSVHQRVIEPLSLSNLLFFKKFILLKYS